MTLTDLITSFRGLVSDTVAPYLWSDITVTTWLAEAEAEAARRKNLIFDNTITIPVTALTASYPLDAAILNVSFAYLVSGSAIYPLKIIDRAEMDYISSTWRTDVVRPTALIVEDTSCELNSAVDVDYTLNLEVYRTPDPGLSDTNPDPEIAPIHHQHLVDWAIYRAYMKKDADAEDKRASATALGRFERYFGFEPQANMAKRVSIPQCSKVWL